ncbi:MAG: DUF4294 domain-containing protein [Flavobacteriaceae bacterium]
MKKLALLTCLFYTTWSPAQETDGDPVELPPYLIIDGDTIANTQIPLKEVVVYKPLSFKTYDQAKQYAILRYRVLKVYPYAKLAADRLTVLNQRLGQIQSKSQRKKYLKRLESFIYEEFEGELKKLTRSQGRILIKLVHRQTGATTHELIKELRNGWRAMVYQTTASFFKLSLKSEYDPETIYEDYLIEDILQRAYVNNQIDYQDTALDYHLDSLYQKWSVQKRPNPLK